MYYSVLVNNVCVSRIKAPPGYVHPSGLTLIPERDNAPISIGSKYDSRTKTWTRPTPRARVVEERETMDATLTAIQQKRPEEITGEDTKKVAELLQRVLMR